MLITDLKAWSCAKKLAAAGVFLVWLISIPACSLSTYYVSALDLTATAGYKALTPVALVETQAVEITATSQPEIIAEETPLVEENTQEMTLVPTVTVETPLPTATRNLTTPRPPLIYYTQSGDTLPVIAARYGVGVEEIQAQTSILLTGLISPGTLLIIPDYYGANIASDAVLPDSEVIYSPSTLGFNMDEFVQQAGGYLSTFREYRVDRWYSGAEIIELVATEESINPRLLLAMLEFQSHWVYGQPGNLAEKDYPLGYVLAEKKGLYKQLAYAVQTISMGYYGWREGRITEIQFSDGTQQRIAPNLNAGSAAIQHFLANFYDPQRWLGALYGPESFPVLFEKMFGNPWLRAQTVEPLFPANSAQPTLELPFQSGKVWSFTGGPHPAWGYKGSYAAIDFAPASDKQGCVSSSAWVVAAAPGLVVREGTGVVVVDLDGDGHEQTGWVMLYLHIATEGKVALGTYLDQDQIIGHPSCEGGSSTGTHVHIARKFNGEWIAADGSLPFTLSGWVVHQGQSVYEGSMSNGDSVVTARTYGSHETVIIKP
jgi:murein DD-endopeptidase MepM/ murein hydrolase activator NlpD